MKTMIRFSAAAVLCTVFFACGSKKSTTTSSAPAQPQTTSSKPAVAPPVPAPPVGEANTTRFLVSFFSEGQGIDLATKEEFDRFLNAQPKKIAYTPMIWGREGSTDYCLSLSELNATEQAEFIRKANAILSKSKLVTAKENTVCEKNGRTPVPVAADDSYRLIVSFYSAGEGVDIANKDAFEKFLNSQAKKVVFETIVWGREASTDYCLKLSELTSAEQMDFVKKAKETVSKSKLVHVDENAKCVHKH